MVSKKRTANRKSAIIFFLICLVYSFFMFIDAGVIGRLRLFNAVVLCVMAFLFLKEVF